MKKDELKKFLEDFWMEYYVRSSCSSDWMKKAVQAHKEIKKLIKNSKEKK